MTIKRLTLPFKPNALILGTLFVALVLGACNSRAESEGGKPSLEREDASRFSSAPSMRTRSDVATTVSTMQNRSRLVLGSPAPGLNFSVTKGASPAVMEPRSTTPPLAIPDKRAALSAFAAAVVKDDYATAFSLLSDLDRAQIGSPTKFGELLAKRPSWISFTLVTEAAQPNVNSVVSSTESLPDSQSNAVLIVSQQPTIDETRGVVASTAQMNFPLRDENGGWKIVWRKHRARQNFLTPDKKLLAQVGAWANERRACNLPTQTGKYDGEYDGGLVGELWLAERLCNLSAPLVVESAGDLDSVLDPQAILDAFGGDAYEWAQVVRVNSPIPFYAVAAPLGDRWVVVALSSLS